jgi:hypothetical protein
MVLPLIFPLSSDPLEKIPPERLGTWPLTRRHRIALRLASLAINPLSGIPLLLGIKATNVARARLVRHIPRLPGRLGGLITAHLRGMFSMLDTWLAVLLSAIALGYRLTTSQPDPEAAPILAIMVALALSTQAQFLFGLDYGSGTLLCRLLPLRGWQILLAKDIAWFAVLLILTAPLRIMPAVTFGLTALAIGHHSSVRLRLPQKRWRFAAGRLLPAGALQLLASGLLGFAEMRLGPRAFFCALVLYCVSLFVYGRHAPGRY